MSTSPDSATPRRPNPLLALLGRALEGALDRVLDLDPETRASLRPLDGRAVTVEFRHTPLAMRIAVAGDRLTIGPAFEGESALRVSASPSALLGLALARGREGAITPGSIDIAGDAELARRIERIASRFSPDFDEAFARVFGDVAGFQIARGVRRALAGVRDGAHAFARDTAEFLSEESRDIVAKAEVDTFLDDVDALRERTDRLEARVRRLGKPGA
ncbi:MAG TPA: SCP2 sterol-binding domain-containing protein [Rhodanobacteraceae bacterium]|nr:SCP2 sterol-binding domain-containing protein [Rhodanobacteraceae bacterium]